MKMEEVKIANGRVCKRVEEMKMQNGKMEDVWMEGLRCRKWNRGLGDGGLGMEDVRVKDVMMEDVKMRS
jgi:hypothetical protein